MNNKGLTLIELMAVIAIIAILAIMIMPGIMTLRSSVLQSTYENKVSQIETAGRDYGMEHITELKSPVSYEINTSNGIDEIELSNGSVDCIYRTVNFLINGGYLKSNNSYAARGQEDTAFINPVTGEEMNNMSVCIRFDNNDIMKREVIAYLVEG